MVADGRPEMLTTQYPMEVWHQGHLCRAYVPLVPDGTLSGNWGVACDPTSPWQGQTEKGMKPVCDLERLSTRKQNKNNLRLETSLMGNRWLTEVLTTVISFARLGFLSNKKTLPQTVTTVPPLSLIPML
jgi:hypothetical protein